MSTVPRAAYLTAAEAWYVARGYLPTIRQARKRQQELYAELVRPGDLCFDVGAHIGDRTRRFLALGARVVAIEPQPSCVERLKFVFGSNRRVSIITDALGETPGSAELAICDSAPTISSMSREFRQTGRFSRDYQWTRSVTVQVTTLDRLIEQFGAPAFIKIDVEGFELQVIRGLSRAVPSLSFEFGWDTIEQTQLCIEHLTRLGAVTANFSLGESMEWGLPEWIPPNELLAHITRRAHTEHIGGDVYVRMSCR